MTRDPSKLAMDGTKGWDPMVVLLIFGILQILIIVIEWWVAGSYFLAYSPAG